MRREVFLAIFGLLAALVAPAAPAAAHTQVTVNGWAFDGAELYTISISRTFDPGPDCIEEVPGPEGEVGCMRWRVNHIRRFNTFDDVVSGPLFIGEDNWVPPEENAGHVGDYRGLSLSPSVDFVIEGKQTGEFVTATGHYHQFEFYVSSLVPLTIPT